jgi:hypothetical protein
MLHHRQGDYQLIQVPLQYYVLAHFALGGLPEDGEEQ